MRTINHKSMTVSIGGVDVTVYGVTVYPYVPATEIDPPEQPFAYWESVKVGDVDVSEWFACSDWLSESLEAAIMEAVSE